MNTLCLMLLTLGMHGSDADVLVVCPPELRPALASWIEHRKEQGHRIAIAKAFDRAAAVRDEIRRIARNGKLRHVLLVGDADPTQSKDAATRKRSVPTQHIKAKVNVRWGSEPEIASDNGYADLNGDHVPDIAVGRLTADSPSELKSMVAKIIAYEKSRDFGTWRRQVNLVAGVGGFGAFADRVLETATKKLIVDGIPNAYRTTMTYASWRSPLCPDPRAFHAATLERLNEGCLFWVYIGHGHRQGLDQMRAAGRRYHIFDTRDTRKLDSRRGSPIACMLSCYTGAFDEPRDCLAEDMLREPGGPVAILAGSRVTMPYAMSVLSLAMMKETFEHRRATLGEVFLRAKRSLASTEEPGETRKMLDVVAGAVSPKPVDLAGERREHLYLFNLLGDPLLRLPQGADVEVEVPAKVTAGQKLTIEGTTPIDGVATIELTVVRDRMTFTPPAREQLAVDARSLADYTRVYRQANDKRLITKEVDVRKGRFRTTLDVPRDAHGACHVRIFVRGGSGHALGSGDIRVERN